MKWFKHDSDASKDAKLKRLVMKYGMEGYGLYWYCLELIVSDIESDKLTFELEHDAEIIAFDTGIHYERVQEMMTHMIKLGLFSESGGVITCLKLAKRLDKSMTSNAAMRDLIAKVRESHDGVMITSCDSHDGVMGNYDAVMQEEIRLDKKRIDLPNKRKESEKLKNTQLTDSFKVTASMRNWFIEKGFNFDADWETEKFKDYFISKGTRYSDWVRTWQNWMRKAHENGTGKIVSFQQRQETPACFQPFPKMERVRK